MKSLFTAVAAAAVFAAAPAYAVPQNATNVQYGTIPVGGSVTQEFKHDGKIYGKGSFNDTILFTIPISGIGSVTFVSIDNQNQTITLTSKKGTPGSQPGVYTDINGDPGGPTTPGSTAVPFQDVILKNNVQTFVSFLAGDYVATVSGYAGDPTHKAGGDYYFQVAAPTPEPAEWALLITGVLGAGYVAIRRRKSNGTANLAVA